MESEHKKAVSEERKYPVASDAGGTMTDMFLEDLDGRLV